MRLRAEKAFLALPRAIDKFDTGIFYSHDNSQDLDPDFVMLKCDLTYLMAFYRGNGYLSKAQIDIMKEQLDSPDRENWLVSFMTLDAIKHKLWTEDE